MNEAKPKRTRGMACKAGKRISLVAIPMEANPKNQRDGMQGRLGRDAYLVGCNSMEGGANEAKPKGPNDGIAG